MWVGGVRIAIIGWGAIARTAVGMLTEPSIEIVAIATRTPRSMSELPEGVKPILQPDELCSVRPDVVAEAASRESVGPWGIQALKCKADFIVSSVSAFADAELLETMRSIASLNGACIQIQPGALAGVDALAAARHMGIDSVEHQIVKPPRAWKGTPAEAMCDLDRLSDPEAFFSESADVTASEFPRNANVAMTTALAGIGPESTKITLIADPATTTNRHEITACGDFGRLEVAISNNPLPENPKTSAMAALSLVRAIQNRASSIVI